ncbi:MFS transporter [Petralouisia muris]|jgi:MFS family permease|uniref:MFS transporter n=1 Tax=Petralouisia muris TaxID=3032872 RepID=A0AC61RX05_9FIRM|nr:MFS transporter [Petralouisia muris]TGY96170.1 MFS transporter [Petralouisia muris]
MKEAKLWTRNFRLVILASAIGTVGAIVGGFALAFLVFDETGSTLASALIVAIQLLPHLLLPVLIAPFMDRLPRKSFLVAGDIANAVLLAGMGLWLLFFNFSYVGYLAVSLLLACIGAVDELAFTSIYPELIPEGAEQKGYAVSSMLYPVLKVIMAPLAAVLLDTLGVAWILIAQSGLSFAAAITESFIHLDETERQHRTPYSLQAWAGDIREAVQYLKEERGLRSIYEYMAVTNGVASGFSPILVAFFRTFPGFTAAMYSAFSVVEFAGRTIGSALQYRIKIPDKKKYGLVFFVYQVYESMDMCLLWLPYPLMLVNRGICGFLGSNSAILRSAAVQRYIPEKLRSRINAFDDVLITAGASVFSLMMGFLGEILDYRWCVTIGGAIAMLASWLLIWGRRKDVRRVYETGDDEMTQ